jgi:hypothetical protein
MKSQIVCLNQILVLVVIHESDMGWEFENPIVIEREGPGIAQPKSSHGYFAERKANPDTDHDQD